jgi:hypothetical protein
MRVVTLGPLGHLQDFFDESTQQDGTNWTVPSFVNFTMENILISDGNLIIGAVHRRQTKDN